MSRKISLTRRVSGAGLSTSPPSSVGDSGAVERPNSPVAGDATYNESGPNRAFVGVRSRRMSMEEADQPKSAEEMVYNPKRKYSVTAMVPPVTLKETAAE